MGKKPGGNEVNEVSNVSSDMKKAVMVAMEYYNDALTGILRWGWEDKSPDKEEDAQQEASAKGEADDDGIDGNEGGAT